MSLRIQTNKSIPKQWDGRKSISVAEYNDWINGNVKPQEQNVKPGPKLRTNHRQDFATYKDGELIITIHELPPSQNRWKQWHWTVLAEETKRWNELVSILALSARSGQFSKPVIKFKFYVPDNRNRDRKNLESWKPLLDGLTLAGVISDDNYKEIQEEPSDIEIDRSNTRTEIVVREG